VVNQDEVVEATQFVTEQARRECHLPTVPPHTVLVGLTGQGKTRGKATLLQIEATISQHLAYIVPDSRKWESRYLLWALHGSYADLRRASDENGSTKGGLTCEEIREMRLARPPLQDQQMLVARLEEQDAESRSMIDSHRRLKELLIERRTSLITEVVTGPVDPRKKDEAKANEQLAEVLS
jgi:type I restriction enzyme S subunit